MNESRELWFSLHHDCDGTRLKYLLFTLSLLNEIITASANVLR